MTGQKLSASVCVCLSVCVLTRVAEVITAARRLLIVHGDLDILKDYSPRLFPADLSSQPSSLTIPLPDIPQTIPPGHSSRPCPLPHGHFPPGTIRRNYSFISEMNKRLQ